MNDNEFKKMINKEFDKIKAAPAAEERILRKLKGADEMKTEINENERNNNITSQPGGAVVKRRWGTAVIAAAAAVAMGIGGFALMNSKKSGKVSTDTSEATTTVTKVSPGAAGADSIDQSEDLGGNTTPLGLKPAADKAGYWELGENNYFCTLFYDEASETFKTSDGKLTFRAEPIEEESDELLVGAPAKIRFIVENNSDSTINGSYFIGSSVYATDVLETYPLQIGYSMNSDEVEQGYESAVEPHGTVSLDTEMSNFFNWSTMTVRADITEDDGTRIVYAMCKDDNGSAGNDEADQVTSTADDDEGFATSVAEDDTSEVAETTIIGDESIAEEDSTASDNAPIAADPKGITRVSDRQVLIALNREGNTFTTADGKLKAEVIDTKSGVDITWTNLTSEPLFGDYCAGLGVTAHIVDNGKGPEIEYYFMGTEQGYEKTLAAGESITITIPDSENNDHDAVIEGASPRMFYEKDGVEYVYAIVDANINA